MNIQEKSKREYFARINWVMDYIDQHLEQALELKGIASIANFSPFHFHQIFTFLIGETPIDYIQRLRVERAAIKLLQDPLLPSLKCHIVADSEVFLYSAELSRNIMA